MKSQFNVNILIDFNLNSMILFRTFIGKRELLNVKGAIFQLYRDEIK